MVIGSGVGAAVELKDIVGYGVPLLIAVGGWLSGWWQRRAAGEASQKQRKLDKVSAYIDAYADLVGLYRFYARRRDYMVPDGNDGFQKDAAGNYVVEREVAQPEERFEAAINSLEGSDLGSAIAQKIVQIRRMHGEIGDILDGIDPSGDLNRQLATLHHETTRSTEFWIKHQDFEEMVRALENATRLRREFRRAVERKLR